MNRVIDYRTAAWQLNIGPNKLLRMLRHAGAIHSHGPERNQPKPGMAHLFDTERHDYRTGQRLHPHYTLLVKPAGMDYLTALIAGDEAAMKRLTAFRIDTDQAHRRMAAITAQLRH